MTAPATSAPSAVDLRRRSLMPWSWRHNHGHPAYPYIALNLVLSGLAGIQAPVILMSQNRAAARDEALAAHHYEEGEKMERLAESTQSLLEQNTQLTEQVHDLAAQIHRLTLHIEQTVAPAAP